MWTFAAGFVFGVICTVVCMVVLVAAAAKDMDHYDNYGGTD